jgi:AcrR family transcriptional regulator
MFSQNPTEIVESERGDERRHEIVSAAFELIAEKGFEGFRIRDVADWVGINNATLHYYFKTKEILIEAVVRRIVQELVSTHDPVRSQALETPLDELQAHLADIRYQIQHTPQRFIVLSELLLRAHREPAIYAILTKTDADWKTFLDDILKRGVEQGTFRADLDVEGFSHTIMMTLKGACLQLHASPADLQRILEQLMAWSKAD